jgi:uncharacterized membrane protein
MAACILRFFNLDLAPLWHDEVETAIWSKLSAQEVWGTIIHRTAYGRYDPQQLPLYFVIVNAWTWVAGASTWLLRFPGVVFSIATVVITAATAERLLGRVGSRWTAWFCAVSPYLVHHAQEARMYPLMSVLAAGGMLLLVRYLNGEDRRLGIAFVLLNWALLATHYYGLFFVTALLCALLLFGRRPLSTWAGAWIGSALGIAALLFVALVLSDQRSGEVYEVGLLVVPGAVWGMLAGYVWLPSAEELHILGGSAIRPYLFIALGTAIPFGLLVLLAVRNMSATALAVVCTVLAVVMLGPFVAHLVFAQISINPRYFMAGAPAFFILLGAGAMGREGRWSIVGPIAAGILLVVMLVATAVHLWDPGQKREDIHTVGAWLDAHVPMDREILVTSDEMASLAYFHWPERRFRLYPERRTVATAENVETLAKGLPERQDEPIHYILGRAWLSDPEGRLRRELAVRYRSCGGVSARGIEVLCLSGPDGVGNAGEAPQ